MATILIVEDDPQVQHLLQESLELEGYSVIAAENGIKALEQLATRVVDIMITDILMPEKEGLGLITELRKTRPDLPIIAISGGSPTISPGCNLELARMFGAWHVFQKPLDMEVLLTTIKDILQHEAE